ncbi:MAG: NAD+ synthase [Planctomycetes bacterium]|nr:NAD+ synthase [Planctomycetota bacterium]
MKIAIAQINPTVGDIAGNSQLIAAAAQQAQAAGAELVVVSELAISGYPPKDLLLREGFVEACDRAVEKLAAEASTQVALLVGHPSRWNLPPGTIGNAASLLSGGRVVQTIYKCLLPNYDVFDERRYFLPAESARPVLFGGLRLGVHICEDAWFGEPGTAYHLKPENRRDPVAELAEAGVDVFINLSASPFEIDKPHRRSQLLSRHVSRHRRPFVFVNQVGGNDDLVFDGNSRVYDAQGHECLHLAPFASDFGVCEIVPPTNAVQVCGPQRTTAAPRSRPADLLDALTLGLRDYVTKSGFKDCVLGLSGGIDSALACYIAAAAVGPEHVHGLALPSRYSSEHSVNDARQLAEAIGVDFEIVPIDRIHQAYEATHVAGADLASQPAGLADQNLQARIRGAIVMIRSNRHGWLALATGNKSELAVGYCTLYGDMAGGFAVLADVFKRDVYAVARYINEEREGREVIPVSSLEKPPSAELAPNQFDQDTLPPYPVLDAILEGLIERELSIATLSQQFPAETVRWVASRLDRNEFKRRQMPPGIKLSQRAFGSGRRMPMAARFNWE